MARLTRKQVLKFLLDNHACPDSVIWWCKLENARAAPEKLWRICARPRWMWWVVLMAYGDKSPEYLSVGHIAMGCYGPNQDVPSACDEIRAIMPFEKIEAALIAKIEKEGEVTNNG